MWRFHQDFPKRTTNLDRTTSPEVLPFPAVSSESRTPVAQLLPRTDTRNLGPESLSAFPLIVIPNLEPELAGRDDHPTPNPEPEMPSYFPRIDALNPEPELPSDHPRTDIPNPEHD